MIDRNTVDKIKAAANIVDVVSEFVTLRKSGVNYKGLCPFHNEKTPSFFVSPARGTCHCFGCGKGGTAVSFIMEHEQMTYPEALRWLANKYHIEIQERELTDREKEEHSERESMFIVNDWAMKYFQYLLKNDADGKALGLGYFRNRGFRDDIIMKFQLGYDSVNRFSLAQEALRKGYKEEFLLKTGICYKNDRGELIDRYAGRVIFPWIGISGKVTGFGGRLLDSRTKGVMQKYVNSMDSAIFHKNQELYGIYQAKRAIVKEDCVYMVEGYTDVISMHQCGIENVVANSGTALSVEQIHILHRFTSNIVLLYDGDSAGIHAAMRGMDLLLTEGMNVKVLLLPNGEDPDSFAKAHSEEELRSYIQEKQTDFIQFKTNLLFEGVTDPAKKAQAIESIIKSVSLVKNPILRDTYIHDCSLRLGIHEATLIHAMNNYIKERKKGSGNDEKKEMANANSFEADFVKDVETLLVQLIIQNGEKVVFRNVEDDEGNLHDLTVSEFIYYDLSADNLEFSKSLFQEIMIEAVERSHEVGFVAENYFIHHENIEISKLAANLSLNRDVFLEQDKEEEVDEEMKKMQEKNELEKLGSKTRHLLLDFRKDYVEKKLESLKEQIKEAGQDTEKLMPLMGSYKELIEVRNKVAKMRGNLVIL